MAPGCTHQFAVSLYEPVGAGHQHPARVGDAQQGPHYRQTARTGREIWRQGLDNEYLNMFTLKTPFGTLLDLYSQNINSGTRMRSKVVDIMIDLLSGIELEFRIAVIAGLSHVYQDGLFILSQNSEFPQIRWIFRQLPRTSPLIGCGLRHGRRE